MQAIITKYLPVTNSRSSRLKAQCARGSIIVGYDHGQTLEGNHISAAKHLAFKFLTEDKKAYGDKPGYSASKNPWNTSFVSGSLPSNDYVHVFIPESQPAAVAA